MDVQLNTPHAISVDSDNERELISLLQHHYYESGLSHPFAAAMARKCVHYGDGIAVVREGPHSTEQSQIAVARCEADPRVKMLQRQVRQERRGLGTITAA